MKAESCRVREGLWRRPFLIGVGVVGAWLWMGLGNTAQVLAQEKLQVVSADSPPTVELDLKKPREISFKFRNISGGELKIGSIVFSAVSANAPAEAAQVTVKGLENKTLVKDEVGEFTLQFPAHSAVSQYTAAVSYKGLDKPNEVVQPPLYYLTVRARDNYLVSKLLASIIALIFATAVLILTIVIRSKGRNFYQSPDGSVSISKVQIWIWTMVIVFAYVYLYLWNGPPSAFPSELWELLGLSALATGGAKYIAVTYKDGATSPEVAKRVAEQRWFTSMLSDDDGQPSVMRLQMFAWTLVTAFLFLMEVSRHSVLWQVPQQLVILMGISQGGYLIDKAAAPKVSMVFEQINPAETTSDSAKGMNLEVSVQILGQGFDPNIVCMIGNQTLQVTDAKPNRIQATLAAGKLRQGKYDLLLQQPGTMAQRMASAFEVK